MKGEENGNAPLRRWGVNDILYICFPSMEGPSGRCRAEANGAGVRPDPCVKAD